MSEAKAVAAKDLASDIIGSIPEAMKTPTLGTEPQAPAPDLFQAEAPGVSPAKPSKPPVGVELDALGRPFDPEKHLTDKATGAPKKNKLGRWMPRSPGRNGAGGPKAAPAAPRSFLAPDEPAPAPAPQIESQDAPAAAIGDKFDALAEVYTRAGYSFLDGIMAGKGEWAPDDEAEHVQLRAAVAGYLRFKGADDLPPGGALAVAILTYGAKRIQKPNTATRLRLFWGWAKARFATWRSDKAIAAATGGAS